MYAAFGSLNMYKECLALQSEFIIVMTYRITEAMLQSNAQFFEHGNKARKLLAHQLRQASA